MAGTKRQNRFAKASGYRQDGHPYPVTSCGRRRAYMHNKKPNIILAIKIKKWKKYYYYYYYQ